MNKEARQLQSFIQGVVMYFEKMTGVKADIGLPSLISGPKNLLLELAAAIHFEGAINGAVYMTGNLDFFRSVYTKVYGPGRLNKPVNVEDIAGEMANTIAGNAQEHFQDEFDISVPKIVKPSDQNGSIHLEEPRYKIPIAWKEHKFFLVIGIKEKER